MKAFKVWCYSKSGKSTLLYLIADSEEMVRRQMCRLLENSDIDTDNIMIVEQ